MFFNISFYLVQALDALHDYYTLKDNEMTGFFTKKKKT